jgi:hypothetical protein
MKRIKDGFVAVLISPDYGSSWSQSNVSRDNDDALFDCHIVDILLDEKLKPEEKDQQIRSYCNIVDYYYSGDLEVAWVPVGSKFRIHEYDGSEQIVFEKDQKWFTA